ncbi:glycosyltransferase [Jannaschia rubra]|uniref:Mycofactocin system glycosyltransferase n=1 Tax=Jannaschia rubra TaxID=282197 RepID=A0A0M6XNH6_9RHOB|nr:glycosyltransferase family 2 protein [Jannaschia rubra]CTQ32716.1 mycofactocin system glycosyltransferase [Jannaschia rubra]SFF88125.1 succinoglycan biosynthesis protein ExoM [Jannaschia rubra]
MTRIAIVMCTFRRPEVTVTLRSLAAQSLPDGVEMRIVVADNDDTPSGRAAVEDAGTAVTYVHAPARNISIARNAGLEAAGDADWIAFIDDDEIAPAGWLSCLLACARQTGADAVFGPAVARYGPEAPEWMRLRDLHSNRPERRGGVVRTGHTCNALLRWGNTPWTAQRFDLGRGTSGGEDTAFFFDLHRAGARFEICEAAEVHEAVPPARLSLGWLARRRFRSGQSYAASVTGRTGRAGLATAAVGKALICGGAAAVTAWSVPRRTAWLLRGALHVGVVAGCLRMRQPAIYGGD